MWGKFEQATIWFISYLPVVLIAMYRYFVELSVTDTKIKGYHVSENAIHVLSLLLIIIVSLLIYYHFPKWMFNKIEKDINQNKRGKLVYIKQFEKPSLNDYTFFLLTLILPLITVDFTSTVSLVLCLSVVAFIILLLTKIDYIIACPLFFVSKYKVWRVSFTEVSDAKGEYITNGYVITKRGDLLNDKFEVKKLINNVYFLK